ncbi:hypothetical protein [Anaerocolumna sp. MB42-C2]|uniref:hypothetical protein n=1 Tax=Anaerocolumna sp. MB42-C2 TaxID=3070997 RepID=UPI0027DEEB52|nr:hypothetical protein [Anaerocolumna sp. MB42-C2]WMJ90681.1 hypothetical protein RBU59_07445 [Anaerocolumna sp. MB42-C2]
MLAQVRPDFNHFTWFGRGPYENYCDRKSASKVGLWHAALPELQHNYMRPQENGNRTDVRFLQITTPYGNGFKVQDLTGQHMGFSAQPYSQEDLDAAEHIFELPVRDSITLHIDSLQCGVGGDVPGFTLLKPPYRIHPLQEYIQEFIIY